MLKELEKPILLPLSRVFDHSKSRGMSASSAPCIFETLTNPSGLAHSKAWSAIDLAQQARTPATTGVNQTGERVTVYLLLKTSCSASPSSIAPS